MKKYSLLVLIFIWVMTCGFTNASDFVNKNIVKVYTTSNESSYMTPWQMEGHVNYEGSGCIIRDNLILTNAHVVSDQTFITVKRSGQTKKYVARVKFVAHECDLAVLEVLDRSFYPAVPPLQLGELPHVGDQVAVYGYPSGAEQLTITTGIVSRVSHETYAHSSVSLLCGQIDAAVNYGNSGGPVIADGKIVGIAMMVGWGENEGFMVSVPVIQHFLEDIEDGTYAGIPDLAIWVQKMENPSMRSYYGMTETQPGVLVRKVYKGSPAENVLIPGDIILAVDGRELANDGTINFRGDERTSYRFVIQNKQIGETVVLRVLRDSATHDLPLTLKIPSNVYQLVPDEKFDEEPVYYIYGGFIFSPLTENLLIEFEDDWNDWSCAAPANMVYAAWYRDQTEDQREVVVIVDVLSDEVNMGYEDMYYEIITSVNGKKLGGMDDLVEAIELNRSPFQIFETESGLQIVLDRKEAGRSKKRILKLYKIKSDRSANLK
jgi:S1-C subfamily serine protease